METEQQQLTKIKYEAPELVRHGDIDELTRGTIQQPSPQDCASMSC